MRLHEQLGGDEPDQEVENMLSAQRRARDIGADLPDGYALGRHWPSVTADSADYGLTCPDCDKLTSDGEYCGECISERCSYYIPDEGGLD